MSEHYNYTSSDDFSQVSNPSLAAALAYRQAGRSVLPVAPGCKSASILNDRTGEIVNLRWKDYQQHHASDDELRRW